MAQKIVATIGSFDGVHRGHLQLLGELKQLAKEFEGRSFVFTFDRLPAALLHPEEAPRLLTSLAEKCERLYAAGVDEVVVLPFSADLARMTSETFMREILRSRYGVDVLLIGYDHVFGSDRLSSFDERVAIGRRLGIELRQAQDIARSGEVVSSSRIRRALAVPGGIEQANQLLGYGYRLRGKVGRGQQIGRTIGFPTANIILEDEGKLLPSSGVYAVRVYLEHEESPLGGMLYIGTRPTVDGLGQVVEVHLFDYCADLYDREIEVELLAYIRGESHFASLEALRQQLSLDEQHCRAHLDRLAD